MYIMFIPFLVACDVAGCDSSFILSGTLRQRREFFVA